MQRHNVGGTIVLADREGGEFKFINPEWSMFRFVGDNKGHFKARKSRSEDVVTTIHMLQVIQESSGRFYLLMDEALKQIKNHVDFEGGPQFYE